jgi:hypothetical protein
MPSFTQSSAQAPASTSKQSYWKAGLGFAAAFAAVGACLFYPPAALFISPVVELLAVNMPAAFGIYGGLAAFGLTVFGIGLGAMGAMGVLCSSIEALFFRKKAGIVLPSEDASKCTPEAAQETASQPDAARGKVTSSPISSPATSRHSSAEDLAQEEMSAQDDYQGHTRSQSH